MNAPLRDQCQGKWQNILPIVGVDSRHLNGKHGPCPLCQGKDRFRFDDKDGRGTYICSKCGAGDGIALAMSLNGWDFKEAAAKLEPLAGSASRQAVSRERDQKALREAMNRLWDSGQPVTYGDPVARYLESRGLTFDEYPRSLRHAEKCRYGDGVYFPAMLAKVTGPDGLPSTIHRTFLTPEGRKAPVTPARKLMPGRVSKGSAIRLATVAHELGIAEGIETALSASAIWNMPVWAAVNAGMLMEWIPPETVASVVVFGDNDANCAGQSAAFALAHRLNTTTHVTAQVEMPIDRGLDWNDVLIAERNVPA